MVAECWNVSQIGSDTMPLDFLGGEASPRTSNWGIFVPRSYSCSCSSCSWLRRRIRRSVDLRGPLPDGAIAAGHLRVPPFAGKKLPEDECRGVRSSLEKKKKKFLAGSFSAVSNRNFASKYAFDSIFQALQDLNTFAPLQSRNFSKKSVLKKQQFSWKFSKKFAMFQNLQNFANYFQKFHLVT